MTVYVDDMRARYGRMIMCHMIADNYDELHAMADRIGVARRWFQSDHYDVSLGKRERALDYGAHEITWRDCGLMMVLRRLTPEGPAAPLLTAEQGRAWLETRARMHDGGLE